MSSSLFHGDRVRWLCFLRCEFLALVSSKHVVFLLNGPDWTGTAPDSMSWLLCAGELSWCMGKNYSVHLSQLCPWNDQFSLTHTFLFSVLYPARVWSITHRLHMLYTLPHTLPFSLPLSFPLHVPWHQSVNSIVKAFGQSRSGLVWWTIDWTHCFKCSCSNIYYVDKHEGEKQCDIIVFCLVTAGVVYSHIRHFLNARTVSADMSQKHSKVISPAAVPVGLLGG